MPARESRIPASSSTMRMLCMLNGDRSRRGFGHYGKLNNEPRADGMVLFHPDRAMMIFHDATDDGQAESGAALFGGEIGQEEFFLELAGHAVACIGDGNLDRVAARHQCSRNLDFSHY